MAGSHSFEAIMYLRLMNQMICIRGVCNQMIPIRQKSQSKGYRAGLGRAKWGRGSV
jgi:hypothetical protein